MNLLRYLEFFVLACLVLVFAAVAHQRNMVWKNDLSPWQLYKIVVKDITNYQ